MHSNTVPPSAKIKTKSFINYDEAETQFIELLIKEDLDDRLDELHSVVSNIEETINYAIAAAYQTGSGDDAAHLFLQRILYRINRLKLFWYDDLRSYINEDSYKLQQLRNQIELVWQQWEIGKLDVESFKGVDVKLALRERVAADIEPPLSEDNLYYRDKLTMNGYRHLVAIGSLDGLVEASQLSRTLGGVGNEIHAVLTRLLVEEYGGGRLNRKHSSHFTTMLEKLGMETHPEAYFNLVPWQLLAIINHSFVLTERKRYFLRYIGGLLYGELSVPSGFRPYQAAGERLGLSTQEMSYWDIHIKVDELHGKWMLDDVALPLVDKYPSDAWEMLLGYDQQKLLSYRAGKAVTQAVQKADNIVLSSVDS
ncbi:MAG: iron-containing redox enzyme family protein [Cyanobacteria bacterium P01_A01_bin.84]